MDKQENDKIESAVANFNGGLHCSQCVLEAVSTDIGIDRDLALKISSGFGGGMCHGELCGAVTGAVMALSLKYGNVDGIDNEAKQKEYKIVRGFCKEFKNINGSILCRDLMGVDFAEKENRNIAKEKGLFKKNCPKYIKDAINILDEFLK